MPLSGKLPNTNTNNGPYPRKGKLRFMRTGLLFCWTIIGFYATDAIWNFYFTENTAPKPISTFNDFLNALVLPTIIRDPNSPLGISPISVAFIVCLLIGCLWATNDWKQEKKAVQEQEIDEGVDIGLQTRGLDKQLVRPQGPPFDKNVLPHPGKLVGRVAERKWLLKELRDTRANKVVALYGFGGVGKTALAAEAVRTLSKGKRYKDGIAVIRCQGLTSIEEILQRTLTRFDPHRRTPESFKLNELEKEIFRLLDGKKALIVLDNVERELAVQNLITCLLSAIEITILLTSRHRPPQFVVPLEAYRELTQLSPDEAFHLFVQYLRRPVSSFSFAFQRFGEKTLNPDERRAAVSIVQILGYHTLAIKIVGTYAESRKLDLVNLERRLNEDLQRVIKIKGDDEMPVRLAFAKSTDGLRPEAQKLFFALVAFSTTEFSREAVLALAHDLNPTKAEEDVEEAVDALILSGLVDAYPNRNMPPGIERDRMRLHPLMHAFAKHSFDQWEESESTSAKLAVATFYADYSLRKSDKVNLLNYDEANITGALTWASTRREEELVTKLCTGMRYFWVRRARTEIGREYLPKGIEAAKSIAQRSQQNEDYLRLAMLQQTHGEMLQIYGQMDKASTVFEEALSTFQQMNHQRGEYETLASLGEIAQQRGMLKEAEHNYRQTLEILLKLQSELDEQDGGNILVLYRQHEGEILTSLGEIAQQRGRLRDAEEYYEQSRRILQKTGNSTSQIHNYTHLGEIAQYRGQQEKAEKYYKDALTIALAEQDRQNEGWVQAHMADLALSFSQLEAASSYCQKAKKIAQDVQHRRCECWMLNCEGKIMQTKGHPNDAEKLYKNALKIAQEVQAKREESKARAYLGDIAQTNHQTGIAEKFYKEALSVADTIQDAVVYAEVALKLGALLVERNNKPNTEPDKEGCNRIKEAIQLYASMKLPDEKKARQISQRLKCGR